LNVKGESNSNPKRFSHLMKHGISNYNYLKPSKPIHDFSLILSKHDDVVVVACRNYPECTNTITVFGLRN
jgi:hypothetical protein